MQILPSCNSGGVTLRALHLFQRESAVNHLPVHRCQEYRCSHKSLYLRLNAVARKAAISLVQKKKRTKEKRGHMGFQYLKYSPYLVRFVLIVPAHKYPKCAVCSLFVWVPLWALRSVQEFFGGDLRFMSSANAAFPWKFLTTPVCALCRSRQFARFCMTSRSGLGSFLPRDWQSGWHT